MDLKKILDEGLSTGLKQFQQLQDSYNERFVSEDFEGFDLTRHTYAHMGKLFGRLASYIQETEDGQNPSSKDVEEKVIPDLLVYASWLASNFGVDLEEAYLKRTVDNIGRVHSDKILSEELEHLKNSVQERYSKK